MRYYELLEQNKSFFVNGYNNSFNIYVLDGNNNWLKNKSYIKLSLTECIDIKKNLLTLGFFETNINSYFEQYINLIESYSHLSNDILEASRASIITEIAIPELNQFILKYLTNNIGEYIITVLFDVFEKNKQITIKISRNEYNSVYEFNPNLPKIGLFTLKDEKTVRQFIFDVKMFFSHDFNINIDTTLDEFNDIFETVIPGHMGIDLMVDTAVNSTEVLAQYNDCDGDLGRTLSKLELFNPSWQFIVQHKGRDFAINLIKKTVKQP